MGKKGSWFSAIKRAFSPHSKEKLDNQEAERKSGKEKKKKGFGKLRHGETNSFLSIFKEPSSIEKILGEAERDHNLVFRPPTPDRSNPSSASPPPSLRPASPRVASPRIASPRATSPKPPPPRANLPRSLSPKSSDRSKPSSASANAPLPLRPASPRVASPRAASPKAPHPRADLPRLDSPRSISPKSSDRSKPSSASANTTLPLRPASTRVPSQRIAPPIVPFPRPISPRVASPQDVLPKQPSPRAEPQRLDSLRPPSPKPPSPRADLPRLDTPRPPSPREDPPKLDNPSTPSPRADPPRLDAPRPTTVKPASPRAVSPSAVQRRQIVYRPEPTLLVKNASAIKIQGAFRGYMARRSFRALKGLVRLQGVVRGYSVKRQTVNAMKYMQQLVRVQSQIQSRRIKTLENQAQIERDEAKWGGSETNDNWDDSVLTKEERDARSQRKNEAIIKRERSMAYAYSNKLWRNSPKSAQDIRSSGGFPLWWNWMDRQLPLASPARSHSQTLRDYRLTPTRLSPSPLSQSSHQHHYDPTTPKSSRSTLLTPSRPIRTSTSRYSRGRLSSPFKDDDSLTSCPPFPSYMAPTVSAKAKARPSSNPKERVMGSPSVSSEKRRMSYPPTQQGHDMFRWNKGSLLMNKGPGSSPGVVLEKHKTLKSVGNLSIDSTVSMPASVGRKPFNRYV